MGMGPIIPPEDAFSLAQIPGYEAGFNIGYNNTTGIKINGGAYEVDGEIFSLAAAAAHTMTSLAAGYDLHYIYVDKSGGTPTTPVFYDTTTEPAAFDEIRRGYYHPTNTADRMVAVVPSTIGAATIDYFDILDMGGGMTKFFTARSSVPMLASLLNPSGGWQVPNLRESSTVLPVNAVGIGLQLSNTNVPGSVALYGASKEWADSHTNPSEAPMIEWGYNNLSVVSWIALAASRNVRIAGFNAADNNLGAWVSGIEWRR